MKSNLVPLTPEQSAKIHSEWHLPLVEQSHVRAALADVRLPLLAHAFRSGSVDEHHVEHLREAVSEMSAPARLGAWTYLTAGVQPDEPGIRRAHRAIAHLLLEAYGPDAVRFIDYDNVWSHRDVAHRHDP